MSYIITGKYKVAFVHVPKTSGTSTIVWLHKVFAKSQETKLIHMGNHATLPEMQLDDDYKSFSIIRNPWDRMVSFYEFARSADKFKLGVKIKNLPSENMEFNDWMLHVHNYYYVPSVINTNSHRHRIFRSNWFTPLTPQSIWLPQDPTITIRFECLSQGQTQLKEMFETDLDFPHEYKTDRRPYQDYYNDHSRELVTKYFALDIDRWNYKF
jgi:hypothetical protein